MWAKSILGRNSSKCKDPEVGICFTYLRHSKEAGTAGVSKVEKEEVKSKQE